jgi:pleiotropic regulator 1
VFRSLDVGLAEHIAMAAAYRRVQKRALEVFEPHGDDPVPPEYHPAQRVRVASLVADEFGPLVAPVPPPGAAAARSSMADAVNARSVAGGGLTTKLLEDAKTLAAPSTTAASASSSSSSLALVVHSSANPASTASSVLRVASSATNSDKDSSLSTPSGSSGAQAAVDAVVASLDEASRPQGVAAGGSEAGMRRAAALAEAAKASSRVAMARSTPRTLPTPQWHAPWELMRVISGHNGWVRCVAVDPSNEWFVTGAADRTIRVSDLATGTLKLTLTGHISAVRGVAISPRHPYLFSCGEDKKVFCWDLEHNNIIRHYHGHLSGVYSIAIHPDLDLLMTGGRDAVCRVWDMRTRAPVHVFGGHTNAVGAIATQSTDPQVITGSMDTTVRVWDLAAGKCMGTLTHHKKGVRSLVMGRGPGSEEGGEHSFVSGAADGIRKWHASTAQFLFGMYGHDCTVHSLACNDDGVLFSGADDGTFRFWDVATGHCFQAGREAVQSGSIDSEGAIFCASFDHTGSRLITGMADKTVRVWRENTDATPHTHPIDMDAYRREVRRAEAAV